ncbi:hypothetical protein POM88_005631 [Heracleum sosnowskyi]|uniref:Uncharacterized protein n=1 Tax=Heracleum sosnowskyi TaxID=360622 RepID=A0AAD8J2B5_9APIA|nr:hypothetical protein POM88_005631 [Heracleum sosnowskyi]
MLDGEMQETCSSGQEKKEAMEGVRSFGFGPSRPPRYRNSGFEFLVEKLEEVDEFILPDIEPLASLICPERLEYPDMFELGDVVPIDNINVYDAFLRPYFPFSMPVSFVVMSNLADACCLERRMRHVASIVGKDFVLVAIFLNGNPPLSVNKEFFKLLWSALSKLHDVGNYFGNLRYGVRVVNNKPILTFPARRVFRDHGYERGVENDLVNVISWAIEAFSDLVIELRCFLSICRDVVPVRNCTVASEDFSKVTTSVGTFSWKIC